MYCSGKPPTSQPASQPTVPYPSVHRPYARIPRHRKEGDNIHLNRLWIIYKLFNHIPSSVLPFLAGLLSWGPYFLATVRSRGKSRREGIMIWLPSSHTRPQSKSLCPVVVVALSLRPKLTFIVGGNEKWRFSCVASRAFVMPWVIWQSGDCCGAVFSSIMCVGEGGKLRDRKAIFCKWYVKGEATASGVDVCLVGNGQWFFTHRLEFKHGYKLVGLLFLTLAAGGCLS